MLNTLLRKLYHYCLTLFIASISCSYSLAGETILVSIDSNGNQQGIGLTHNPSISANGRFVAFDSERPFAIGDTNSNYDVFVHDLVLKTTTQVSVSSNGTHGILASYSPRISADGRFVTFASDAKILVPGDTNGKSDVFVHDLATKKTVRVSVSSTGEQGNDHSGEPSISADGRFIAFSSDASNLVAGDADTFSSDVFIHDRIAKTTVKVSIGLGGETANNRSYYATISGDGRFAAFCSGASNLVAGDTEIYSDVFVYDRLTKVITRVSVDSNGNEGNYYSCWGGRPTISANGQFVAYSSSASNLVDGDSNGAEDIFVRDRFTKTTTRVSVGAQNKQSNNWSQYQNISANGQFISFSSSASNLVSDDSNGRDDVFVYNRIAKTIKRVSLGPGNIQGNLDSGWVGTAISADGRFIAFDSFADNLVLGDTSFQDIFVRDSWLNPNFTEVDQQISSTLKPASLTLNSQGHYVYTITNNGPGYISFVKVQHLLANGTLINLTPSTGKCNRYANLNLCDFGGLPAGGSVTLEAYIKAVRNPVSQHLSLSSGGRVDPSPENNYLDISTPVTP